MIVLTKLIMAHLAGDFLLQPNSWIKAKEKKKISAYQLYLHAFLHGVLIMLLVWDWTFLPWAALLTFSHLVIDAVKLVLQKNETKRTYFFADQIVHITSIYLIFCWYSGYTILNPAFFDQANLLLLNNGYLFDLALFLYYQDVYRAMVTSHRRE